MKIYILQNLELGWDNVVAIGTTKAACIRSYTDSEVDLKSEEEAEEWIKKDRVYRIDYKFLDE